jgi:hypothetical protein
MVCVGVSRHSAPLLYSRTVIIWRLPRLALLLTAASHVSVQPVCVAAFALVYHVWLSREPSSCVGYSRGLHTHVVWVSNCWCGFGWTVQPVGPAFAQLQRRTGGITCYVATFRALGVCVCVRGRRGLALLWCCYEGGCQFSSSCCAACSTASQQCLVWCDKMYNTPRGVA